MNYRYAKHKSMNASEQHWYPKGFFPLLLRVEDKMASTGGMPTPKDLLERFVALAKEKYDLRAFEECEGSSECGRMPTQALATRNACHTCRPGKGGHAPWAEKHIAVPFPDRENIRIDYNIFSSEIDDECGCATRFHFHMESDF